MRRRAVVFGLVAAVFLSLGPAPPEAQTAPGNVLVSVSSSEEQGNGDSQAPSISADGNRIAFASSATNLVPDDTNDAPDAFVRDIAGGWTKRVSVKSGGGQTSGISVNAPVISGNGRWVAFVSKDDTITPKGESGNQDVFLHDLRTSKTILVSKLSSGRARPTGDADTPSLSYSGRFISFSTNDSLMRSDHNHEQDVYVWNRVTGKMRIASLTNYGTPADSNNDYGMLSADGGCVAFRSFATNLTQRYRYSGTDVFVRDLVRGGTRRGSVPNRGARGGHNSFGAGLNSNGTQLLFGSKDALVAKHDGYTPDVYRRDLRTGRTFVVTRTSGRGKVGGNGTSISGNGRYAAVKLVRFVNDTQRWKIVVRDMRKGVNRAAAVALDGGSPNGPFDNPVITLRANAVAYESAATNLVVSDANDKIDVFLRPTGLKTRWSPSRRPSGCGNGLRLRPRPFCFDEKADWIGSRRDEHILGTWWSESHYARGGNDSISAWLGRDRVCGNDGRDSLDGGPGRDLLSGGRGDDELIGSGGHDVCYGGPGRDKAKGCEMTFGVP